MMNILNISFKYTYRLDFKSFSRKILSTVITKHDKRLWYFPVLTKRYLRSFSLPSTSHVLDETSSVQQQQPPQCRLPSDFLSNLRRQHPHLKISTNPYDLISHAHGESYHPESAPDAVLYPSKMEEIRDILRLCCREVRQENANHSNGSVETLTIVEVVSVIPFGAGTSVEGHVNMLIPKQTDEIIEVPTSLFTGHHSIDGRNKYKKVKIERKGGVSIDMSNFQSIGEVEHGNVFVKVGAGVRRKTLNEALRHTGLQFMVDPGADATIGGMVACRASGTAAVKYGTMNENVHTITAVLPPSKILTKLQSFTSSNEESNSDIVHCGTTALKSSAGYNLTALLTGSEGTLGVITEVTVKLHPIPFSVVAAKCTFDNLHSAAEAVAMIRMMSIPLSRVELLDEMSVLAFNKYCESQKVSNLNDDHAENFQVMEVKPTLFLEFSSHSEQATMEDMLAAKNICVRDFGATDFVSSSDEETRRALWAARHRLYYSTIALRSGEGEGESATPRSTFVTDACVPLPHFATIFTDTVRDVKTLGIIGSCFGHAGDGNFHCIMPMVGNDSEDYKKRVFQVNENLIERVIRVGGTCTGEHGVGYGKKKHLKEMYGEGGVHMMKLLKKALDPWNIMNPCKIVDI